MSKEQQAIDGYLGIGWYNGWMDLQAQRHQELATYAALKVKLGQLADVDGLHFEFKDLEEIGEEYDDGMHAVIDGKLIKKQEANLSHDLLSDALSLAEKNNEMLGLFMAAGFFDAITLLIRAPYRQMQTAARDLEFALKILKTQLEKAKRQRNEAILQTLIDVIVTVALPHVSILTRVVVLMGQYTVDNFLGVEKNPVVGGTGDTLAAFSTFSESAGQLDNLGVENSIKAGKIGKWTGRLGPLFSGYELWQGNENIDQVKAAIEEVRSRHKLLMQLIRRYLPAIISIRQHVLRFRAGMIKNRAEAEALRREIRLTIGQLRAINGGRPWQAQIAAGPAQARAPAPVL